MRLSFKQMFAEFKEFAFKGNMIDLAVAVVLGAAFSGVVNSLVKDIIMPAISYVTTAASSAGEAASNAAKHVAASVGGATAPTTAPTTQSSTQAATTPAAPPPPPPAPPPAAAPNAPPNTQAVDFSWTIGRIQIGHFIAELLNFILVAFAVFLMVVKLLGSVMKRVKRTPVPEGPTTKECPRCLSLIPIMATKCAHCTADLPAPPATPTPEAAPQT